MTREGRCEIFVSDGAVEKLWMDGVETSRRRAMLRALERGVMVQMSLSCFWCCDVYSEGEV